jgi:hypothetical protein
METVTIKIQKKINVLGNGNVQFVESSIAMKTSGALNVTKM